MHVSPVTATVNANIARALGAMAAAHPGQPALKIPRGRTRAGEIDYLVLSFAELDAEVAAWSLKLEAAGIRRGDRTLVMVRQGLPLIASVFALFSLGAVPVVIDPGMGLKSFLRCVEASQPRALVGITVAQVISRIFRRAFHSVGPRVGASGSLTARLGTSPRGHGAPTAVYAPAAASDLAAILFTSGSTGAAKGVRYDHGMFEAQVRLVRETYAIQPGEIDLPLLPIFALFNPALGMTTIVPELDPRRPAALEPARIVQAIRQENVTNSFGSPTLWRKIGEHCITHGVTLPSVRRVLCAGAPVPAPLWESARTFLPKGELHSPYGATEALPVSSISAPQREAAAGALTAGACVGKPVAGMDVRIIAVTDEPIADDGALAELAPDEVGEIIVRGPVVSTAYDAEPGATARAKIRCTSASRGTPASDAWFESAVAVAGAHGYEWWHRMGDCGYRDASGRIWFCGRKAERVETTHGTLHTEVCEPVFRRHPRATRCALIGVGEKGRQRPAIVVEATVKDSAEARTFARELRALALEQPATAAIKLFYFHPAFPVDVRHNAKIHRLTLAQWAATAVGYESDPKR